MPGMPGMPGGPGMLGRPGSACSVSSRCTYSGATAPVVGSLAHVTGSDPTWDMLDHKARVKMRKKKHQYNKTFAATKKIMPRSDELKMLYLEDLRRHYDIGRDYMAKERLRKNQHLEEITLEAVLRKRLGQGDPKGEGDKGKGEPDLLAKAEGLKREIAAFKKMDVAGTFLATFGFR